MFFTKRGYEICQKKIDTITVTVIVSAKCLKKDLTTLKKPLTRMNLKRKNPLQIYRAKNDYKPKYDIKKKRKKRKNPLQSQK